ncbi:hypothetical protein [Lacihabitans sp. LS3-19]|uniref:hypothetical protein n=1 Tax=Lacihabitans sp. LS3-19 TaxID=2487335 RepID=UPI0020CE22F9|nr:hypothetical protein [Lacihabitans sp. LS3-19]
MSKDKGNKNSKKIAIDHSLGKQKELSAYKSESKSKYAAVETANPKLDLKAGQKQKK